VELKGGGAVFGWRGSGAAVGRWCSVGGGKGAVQLKGGGAVLEWAGSGAAEGRWCSIGVGRERCS